jgi:Flp pilus assembly protein TadD
MTVEVIATLAMINRQLYNRQLAMCYAEHDTKGDEALSLTTAELAVRKDVHGYDAQAWALYKNGRLQEAKAAAEQALAQRTPDATIWYHAGLIDKALGRDDAARTELRRALTISPDFDPLQAPRARAALAELGVRP